jgi:hypothetical protein
MRLPASVTPRNEDVGLSAMNAPRRLYAADLANGEKFLHEEADALSGPCRACGRAEVLLGSS